MDALQIQSPDLINLQQCRLQIYSLRSLGQVMVKPLEASGQMPDLQRHSKQGMLQEEMRTNHMISDMLNTNKPAMLVERCKEQLLRRGPVCFLSTRGGGTEKPSQGCVKFAYER